MELTPEEKREAEQMQKDEQLRRRDPAAHMILINQRKEKQLRSVMQHTVSSAPSPTPLNNGALSTQPSNSQTPLLNSHSKGNLSLTASSDVAKFTLQQPHPYTHQWSQSAKEYIDRLQTLPPIAAWNTQTGSRTFTSQNEQQRYPDQRFSPTNAPSVAGSKRSTLEAEVPANKKTKQISTASPNFASDGPLEEEFEKLL